MQLQRFDRLAIKRHGHRTGTLSFAIPGLFLGWGQRRSGAGAASAAWNREQVGGVGIMWVAHLNILFGNGDRNRIALFMVTVTEIRAI
ncbi:hypothetical protein [Aeromonas dhakensis]|uniref:hypothetical protein n=1 Tax=Aeromonas dhakensis TaxID=196024 RepID=UPI0038D12220